MQMIRLVTGGDGAGEASRMKRNKIKSKSLYPSQLVVLPWLALLHCCWERTGANAPHRSESGARSAGIGKLRGPR